MRSISSTCRPRRVTTRTATAPARQCGPCTLTAKPPPQASATTRSVTTSRPKERPNPQVSVLRSPTRIEGGTSRAPHMWITTQQVARDLQSGVNAKRPDRQGQAGARPSYADSLPDAAVGVRITDDLVPLRRSRDFVETAGHVEHEGLRVDRDLRRAGDSSHVERADVGVGHHQPRQVSGPVDARRGVYHVDVA